MPEVTKKVAQSIEILKSLSEAHKMTMDLGALKDIKGVIDLLQAALDKLCEETK